MRIQFINPSVWWYTNFQYRMLPTLSLPILVAVFRRAGHDADSIDLEALRRTPDQYCHSVAGSWPDVIGITGLSLAQQGLRAAIEALRKAGFPGRIVTGGVHLTLFPQDGLDWGADLVVTGECEGNIVELIESGATGIHAGVPAMIQDIPLPDWDHHDPALLSYPANLAMLRPGPSISMWSRCCPGRCTFCSNPVFSGKATRYRPAQNVVAEMTDLHNRGARKCFVYDDELAGTKQPGGWMRDIADGIQDLGIGWITQGRCSRKHITPELLGDMKRSGCFYILWGVESFSPTVLRAMRKGTTPEDIWHTLRLSREAGINNGVLTMIGNYQETDGDIAVTAQALEQAYAEGLIQYRQTSVCVLMPGTELTRSAQREGWYREPPNGGLRMLAVHQGTPWVGGERLNWWLGELDRRCPQGDFGQP
jgi:anaerobic magnesium-protoporphyrin IX monomethyl ester cyclase